MLNHRRAAALVLLTVALSFVPGLCLAAGQRQAAADRQEGLFTFLIDWMARGWDSFTGPAAEHQGLQHAAGASGAGIDPNGNGGSTGTYSGGGTTASNGGQ